MVKVKRNRKQIIVVLSALIGISCVMPPAFADDDKAKDAHVHIPFLDLDVNGNGVKLNAPFVKLDKRSGNPRVKINAPFVNVDDRQGDAQVNVNAPFVNVNKQHNNPHVKVDAPLVNVNSGNPGARVNAPFVRKDRNGITAPFVKVDPQGGDGVNVQAPFVNVNKPRKDASVQVDAPGVDLNVRSDDTIEKNVSEKKEKID